MRIFTKSILATLAALAFAVGLALTLPTAAHAAGPAKSFHHRGHHTYTGKVNINTASESQLTALPGIGPAKAKRIVAARRARKFRRPQGLVRVKGIGPKTVKKLLPYLSVSGPTTFRAS